MLIHNKQPISDKISEAHVHMIYIFQRKKIFLCYNPRTLLSVMNKSFFVYKKKKKKNTINVNICMYINY